MTTRALAVLAMLTMRRVSIDTDTFTRLMACTDYEQVKTWLERSSSCASTDEVFA